MIGLVGDVGILLHQFRLHISGTAALPHDRVIDGLAGLAVPEDDGLALVGDTDRRDIRVGSADLLHCLSCNGELCLPDLVGVMLDPAGLRIILRKLFLRHAADLALFVEEDAAVAGRAGVQCHYIFSHNYLHLTLSDSSGSPTNPVQVSACKTYPRSF